MSKALRPCARILQVPVGEDDFFELRQASRT
jgi:hypothetical protein